MVSASFHKDSNGSESQQDSNDSQSPAEEPEEEDLREEDRLLYGLSYTLGLHFPINRFFLDTDVTYQWLFPDLHLDDKSDDVRWRGAHEQWLKVRLLVGARVWGRLEVFGGGGVRAQLDENSEPFKVHPEWTLGVNF